MTITPPSAAARILAALPFLLAGCSAKLDRVELQRTELQRTELQSAQLRPPRPGSKGQSENMASATNPGETPSKETKSDEKNLADTTELATFGAGCFWCVEAVLEQLDGVREVASGYMGGEVLNPTYEQVCSGTTGHAEVVQATFDPAKISFQQLLEFFWKLHDPTTLNRQGDDSGTQYRSAIFYHSDAQREAAEKSKKARDASGAYANRIVTEITKAGTFFKAEGYHQDYYRLNKSGSYCRFVIAPKLDMLGLEK